MPKLNSRDGFALPMALLVMVVLTAGIAAGFAATSAEVVTNAAHRGDNKAYNIAEAGLEKFLAERTDTYCDSSSTNNVILKTGTEKCLADPTLATANGEWKRITFSSRQYADVKTLLIREYINDSLPAIYLVSSTGTDSSTQLSGGSISSVGKRTVGMLAAWGKAVVDVKGAWFALSGLHKNGNAGRIDGADECPLGSGGGKPTLPGAVVPKGGQFSGDPSAFQGTPPIDTSKTFDEVKSSVKLDWAGILAGSITADFEVPQQDFPSADWFSTHPNDWPTIRVHTQDFPLPRQGRGMIIADSNFIISGSNMWDGIVLIGGQLTSNGNNTTSGATLSGLNFLLPGAGTPTTCTSNTKTCSEDDSEANGQKTYVYNSCNVEKASSGIRVYKSWNNTWLDNLPVW